MLSRMAAGKRPTYKKNGRIMMARCLSIVGKPCSEIPHAPHLFELKFAIPPQLQHSGEAGWDSPQFHKVSL